MPPKVSNSKTQAKSGAAKPKRAGAPATSARTPKSTPAEEPAAPVAPRPPAEALSLIEPKQKKVRKPDEGRKLKSFLPPISKISAPAATPEPEPIPESEPVAEEVAPAPLEEAPVVDDRKVIHIKPRSSSRNSRRSSS